MNVTIVTTYFHSLMDSLENCICRLSNLLIQKKFNINVSNLSSDWNRECCEEETIEGIHVYHLPYLFIIPTAQVIPLLCNSYYLHNYLGVARCN